MKAQTIVGIVGLAMLIAGVIAVYAIPHPSAEQLAGIILLFVFGMFAEILCLTILSKDG